MTSCKMDMRIFFLTLAAMLCYGTGFARLQVSVAHEIDTTKVSSNKHSRRTHKLYMVALPSAAVAYGFLSLGSHVLGDVDRRAKYEFSQEHPHSKATFDDYLQFAPGAAVFALSAAGVKGRNSIVDQGGVYLLSNLFLNVFCQGVKNITSVTRPDGTSNSFPSGHTAEAFASAEFLRREYGNRSLAYSITGYTSAVAVGYFRMYNNKHWFSDVVAGAGVGILSTEAAYLLYPKVRKLFTKKQRSNAMAFPTYSHGSYGLAFRAVF